MAFSDSSRDWYSQVASAADVTMRPWLHAVVNKNANSSPIENCDESLDLIMRIECRNQEGKRYPKNDLDLEVYRSGCDVSLMLCWCNQLERPMLWHGKHSVWMNAENGMRCQTPLDGEDLESLARRLRALFASSEEN